MTNKLEDIIQERILILDGAMGTIIQKHKLSEEYFREKDSKITLQSLKGNNDLLVLTQPDIIKTIHLEYLEAGADIITTNTFNSNRVSMADYGMENFVYELNYQAALLAKSAVTEFEGRINLIIILLQEPWGQQTGQPQCHLMLTTQVPGQ